MVVCGLSRLIYCLIIWADLETSQSSLVLKFKFLILVPALKLSMSDIFHIFGFLAHGFGFYKFRIVIYAFTRYWTVFRGLLFVLLYLLFLLSFLMIAKKSWSWLSYVLEGYPFHEPQAGTRNGTQVLVRPVQISP